MPSIVTDISVVLAKRRINETIPFQHVSTYRFVSAVECDCAQHCYTPGNESGVTGAFGCGWFGLSSRDWLLGAESGAYYICVLIGR